VPGNTIRISAGKIEPRVIPKSEQGGEILATPQVYSDLTTTAKYGLKD
jgi:hypothetical protein